jgi:ABC-type glycerol-3-phosphate transport system permease component
MPGQLDRQRPDAKPVGPGSNSVEVRTITTGLTLFIVEDVFFWGPMMAAACLATVPPVVVYLVFQRWVVKGLTLGAVKG